jgi:tetratricopeptide (TPR) repeat protein
MGATLMSDDKYLLCSCGSGRKFKFCCYERRGIWRGMSEQELIQRAAEFPVGSCYISRTWQERGLAHVVVLRQVPDGTFVLGAYLVDVFCLGVKNAFSARLKNNEVRPFLEECPEALREIPYEDARSVILGGIGFARQFGFEPDDSWNASQAIVEPERLFNRRFDFGKDGQPLYVQGPNDDVRAIMKKLDSFIKEGCANYLLVTDEDDETEFDDWCDEVSCLMEEGHFRDARNEIEEMLERYPDRWEPLYLKGTCLVIQGKSGQAIPLLRQAIAAEPSPQAYLNLSAAYQSLSHLEDWITCLRKVVELDGEAGLYGQVAKVRIDKFAASIRKSDGISLDQYFAVGKVYDEAFRNLTTRRFDDAVSAFSEVLKALPHHVQSYGNLGLAYAGLGQRDRAIACLDKAIELDADYQPAIDNRRILLAAQDERLAVQSMREIDFYGDRARACRRRQSKVPIRVLRNVGTRVVR